jgi:hypothetical protein
LLSAWIPYVLFAAVIILGIPLLCWLAPDEEPSNEISQEQEKPPRETAEMSLAA